MRTDAVKHDARAYPWWLELAVLAGSAAIAMIGRTWRIERVGVVEYDAELARGARCVFAFWHARLLPLVFTHRGRGIAVLVSTHRDGELITRVMERFGFATARGSSTRGGEEGMRELLDYSRRGVPVGVTPDGPRGPAEKLKPGVVYLASRAGVPVVPVASGSSHYWRFRSWDGFRVPRPFARVVVAFGEPIAIPSDLERDAMEEWRLRVESALSALTRDVDARAEVRP